MARRFRSLARLAGLGLTICLGILQPAAAAEPLRIAVLDTLSGPFAREGKAVVQHFLYVAETINRRGGADGHPIEIVALDNKGSVQESLVLLRQIADRGIRYVAQGNGSHVAGALIEAIEKHNDRRPDTAILYLNYSAVDPSLTNEKCSFWHFRFDANAEMRLAAITDYMARRPEVKKVFLINQDYAHGQQVSSITKRMLVEKKPDVEIAGDVLHPIGKVKDFSPYVMQIKASGAETVVTGNWGNDLALLVKAGAEAGLDVAYYSFYAGGFGVPTAMGAAGNDRVYQITEWHRDIPIERDNPELEAQARAFAEATGGPWYFHRIGTALEMLTKAVERSRSTAPLQVALALEGMRHATPLGDVEMRREDHQLLQPLFISRFSDRARHDAEGTGFGFVTVASIAAADTALPSRCQMRRPRGADSAHK